MKKCLGHNNMGIRRTALVKKVKGTSYSTWAVSGGSGGSSGSIGIGGHGGGSGGTNIQLLMQKEKERKKQEVKNQLKDYKRQLELKEEMRKQSVKIEKEVKQDLVQRHMVDSKVLNTHSHKIPDRKERIFLCDMIETNPKEDNVIIKIIKNIGKKKPPKNMTIVQ